MDLWRRRLNAIAPLPAILLLLVTLRMHQDGLYFANQGVNAFVVGALAVLSLVAIPAFWFTSWKAVTKALMIGGGILLSPFISLMLLAFHNFSDVMKHGTDSTFAPVQRINGANFDVVAYESSLLCIQEPVYCIQYETKPALGVVWVHTLYSTNRARLVGMELLSDRHVRCDFESEGKKKSSLTFDF